MRENRFRSTGCGEFYKVLFLLPILRARRETHQKLLWWAGNAEALLLPTCGWTGGHWGRSCTHSGFPKSSPAHWASPWLLTHGLFPKGNQDKSSWMFLLSCLNPNFDCIKNRKQQIFISDVKSGGKISPANQLAWGATKTPAANCRDRSSSDIPHVQAGGRGKSRQRKKFGTAVLVGTMLLNNQ